MKYTFYLLLICSAVNSQQITVKGVVTSEDGLLPGAIVWVKNSELSTQTDFDGAYSITIPDDEDTLNFSFIGYRDKEVDISKLNPGELDNLTVTLKYYSYFNPLPDYLIIGFYSGLNNSNTGFYLETWDFPDFDFMYTQMSFGYQKQNQIEQINASLALYDLFRIGDNWFSLEANHRSIIVENQFDIDHSMFYIRSHLSTRRIESYPHARIGVGTLDYNGEHNTGVSLGLYQYLKKGISITFNSTYWFRRWQNEGRIKWENRNVKLFYNLNIIGSYTEHNLVVGYKINF